VFNFQKCTVLSTADFWGLSGINDDKEQWNIKINPYALAVHLAVDWFIISEIFFGCT
jgi:hypothetical protein